MKIGDKEIGAGRCYIIAELGANHNGNPRLAVAMARAACGAGVDAVKLQKRTPELAVREDQRDTMRDTPWGRLSYLDYRRRLELPDDGWADVIAVCESHGVHVFASSWDIPALEWVEQAINPPAHKIASACLTDHELVMATAKMGKPVIMSTGGSTSDQISAAVALGMAAPSLAMMHTHSAYPSEPADIRLGYMASMRDTWLCPVGYSGHERGLQISLAAVAMGAEILERHFTTDRTLWGTDQAASLEPHGMATLVRDVRIIEEAMGYASLTKDGKRVVSPAEVATMAKLRRVS